MCIITHYRRWYTYIINSVYNYTPYKKQDTESNGKAPKEN